MPPEERISQLEDKVEQLEGLEEEVSFLQSQVAGQPPAGLDRLSSPEAKDDALEVVFELLSDYFFERVNFTSFPFSQIDDRSSFGDDFGTTSTSDFIGTSRITDTAEGRLHEVGNRSKTRLDFYVSNPDQLVGYVLSPVVFDSFASLNSFSSMSIFRSYVGLKIDQGTVSVAVKQAGGVEELYSTDVTLEGSGATATYVLEIIYNGNQSSIHLNGSSIGRFNTNFILPDKDTKTFLPLLSPGKSADGSRVNIVIENFQFLQDRE